MASRCSASSVVVLGAILTWPGPDRGRVPPVTHKGAMWVSGSLVCLPVQCLGLMGKGRSKALTLGAAPGGQGVRRLVGQAVTPHRPSPRQELELVEDVWRGEAQDLLSQIAQLQEENKQLMTNLSHKDVSFSEEEFQKHEGEKGIQPGGSGEGCSHCHQPHRQ